MIDPDRPGGRKERKIGLFIANLLTHATVEQAASAAGVSSASAWRYMRDESILLRVSAACRDSLRQSQALLQAASLESVECLRGILRDGESQGLQLTAARTLLELGMKAVERADIEERLSKLETIANSRGWRGAGDEQRHPPAPQGVNGHA
jgi:hypothetical protein